MDREVKTYVLKRPVEEAVPRKLSIDYAAALNQQQLAAVSAGEGPSLVIAGAGSGKTRTLVYRVAYLIDSGIDPSNILLLTFTRKSAQEMLARAGDLIGARSQRVCGGTFHSVANLLLRRYGRSIGVEPGFTILDRGDAEDLIALEPSQKSIVVGESSFATDALHPGHSVWAWKYPEPQCPAANVSPRQVMPDHLLRNLRPDNALRAAF
ncbi:MAG: UvrD-helicase domain-containing protein [Nitrospira sp.]|nr:UvrD-helicase domain-containing protein [Nitrospira sp.]